MNVLVTGGNGYIGSRLAARMQQEGWRLTLLDLSFTASCEQRSSHLRRVGMDAADPLCNRIFADSDYTAVVHLACTALPEQGGLEAASLFHRNLQALDNILHLALESHAGKVIVLFDYDIYGEDGVKIKSENAVLHPVTETGRQEVLRDALCDAYSRLGLEVVKLRTGIVYGPSITICPDVFSLQQQVLPVLQLQPGRAVGRLMQQADDASDDCKIAPETNSRLFDLVSMDCIFINDLVEAIIRVCETATSPLLNIGTGKPVTLADVRRLSHLNWQHCQPGADQDNALSVESSEKMAPAQQGRLDHCAMMADAPTAVALDQSVKKGYCLDYTRAAFELGWSPRFNLEEGIAKTVRFLCSHQDQTSISVSAGEATVSSCKRLWQNLTAWFRQLRFPGWAAMKMTSISLALFSLVVLYTFIFAPRSGSEIDLFIPYIILVSAWYGSREGYFAAGLSISARFGSLLLIKNDSLAAFFQDVDEPIHMAFYFLLALIICRIVDRDRQQKADLQQKIIGLHHERDYLMELYQSSLQVKETLQKTIADTQQSFSRIQYILKQFNDAPPSAIGEITVRVVSEILNTPTVSLYQTDESGEYLLRIAGAGAQLPDRLSLNSSRLLSETVRRRTITINTKMEPACPLVCAPVPSADHNCPILLFLDGIELMQLNQHYLNTLNSLVQLVGYYLQPQIKHKS